MKIGRVLALFFIGLCVVRGRSISSLEAPRGCTWEKEDNDKEQSLVCRLRTISTAPAVIGNLSSAQAESVKSLGLECNDALFSESQLDAATGSTYGSNGFLAPLSRLEKLRIDHCKIRHLPGGVFASAHNLRSLTVRSHSGDWSSITTELHRDALRGLLNLQHLDLSENNIWTLPSELLCSVERLTSLNLTSNRLQDVGSLGFSDWRAACAQNLEVLDLSGNDLSALPDNSLSGLRSLTVLRLQNNAIASVGDHALNDLVNLKSLNMSSNRLVALPPELFSKTRFLNEIVLSNNSLAVLAPGLLDGLEQLQLLDLSNNELTSDWVKRGTFARLARLALLDLSFNALKRIDAHVFKGLANLQILNLEHNDIDTLTEGCFGSLGSLRSLSLSHNKLVTFEVSHSIGLDMLRQLILDDNRLRYIQKNAFANLSSLLDLRLSGNGLTDVPEAVHGLNALHTLDLGNNPISAIRDDTFKGLNNLTGLRLVDNKLENISRGAFANLPSLQILNLGSNFIRHIDQGAFAKNTVLMAIRLDGNNLTEIREIFQDVPSLLLLNISVNKLLWFDYSHLPENLEWLDLHDNQLKELGNEFSLHAKLRIKILDASYNFIEEISDTSLPNSIEKLYLNNNRILTVAPGTFMQKEHLEKVYLSGNDIQHLEIGALELKPIPNGRKMPEFFIGDNPILCDCTMEWLPRINEPTRLRQYPSVMDLDAITCDMVHARAAPKRPLLSLKSKDFVCRYETHCFAICHCCDFDACDCEMTCPDNCSCYHDHSWSSNVVDCSNAGYRFVPERIPMDATEIYLDGNDLGDLGSHVFIGKRKLEVLYLNNSAITAIHNRTFNGAESLKVLHLETNALRELKGYEFDQLEHVAELYLDHNAIAAVGNTTFKKMKKLEVLRLDNNRIIDFWPWNAVANYGVSVSLEGNSWSCDCANAARLRSWVAEHGGNVADRMYCRDGIETLAQAIRRCGDPATEAVSRGIPDGPLVGGNFVPLLAGVLVVIIAVCLFLALGFIFRQDVRLWAHARYGLRLGKITSPPEEERDRLYDGYFIYSERDEDFVSRYLAAELEQTGLALCLHWRDLPPARPQEAVPPAAAAARRIVIAFSPVFLNNEWQHPEFRAALRAALDTIRPASRRRRVIILLATEAPTRDPELQLLLQTCTVIVWGEKRFWEKLRYAMPDSSDKRCDRKTHTSKTDRGSGRMPTRYTAAPSVVVDAWTAKPAGPPVTANVLVAPIHAPTPTPTQSTYVSSASSRTEDEDSGLEQQHHHHHHPHEHHQGGYSALHASSVSNVRPASLSSRSSHLYSTIPELGVQTNSFGNSPMPNNPRTYFV